MYLNIIVKILIPKEKNFIINNFYIYVKVKVFSMLNNRKKANPIKQASNNRVKQTKIHD